MHCQRFFRCPFFGPGCEAKAERDCGVLDYIKKELSRFGKEIQAVLEERHSFLYEEGWYRKLRGELLKERLITEKDILEIEQKAVDEFIKSRKKT
jgi:hypothetical protein